MSADLPRRLAVGDPAFRRYAGRIRVLLNGQEVERCVAFDVPKGTVTLQKRNGAGRIFIDEATGTVAVEKVRGSVKVQWR